MISPSNSLNRVKIMSVILLIKLSEAPPFHSHPELVSPISVPKLHLFLCLALPDWGHSCPVTSRYTTPAQNSLLSYQLTHPMISGHFYSDGTQASQIKNVQNQLIRMLSVPPSPHEAWCVDVCCGIKSESLFSIIPYIYTALDHLASVPRCAPLPLLSQEWCYPPARKPN